MSLRQVRDPRGGFGSSTSAAKSSSMIFRFTPGFITAMPVVTEPDTVTSLWATTPPPASSTSSTSESIWSSTAVMVTVPELLVAPTANVSIVSELSV